MNHAVTNAVSDELDAILQSIDSEIAKRAADAATKKSLDGRLYVRKGTSRDLVLLGAPILLQFHSSTTEKKKAYSREYYAICSRERPKGLLGSGPCRWCDDEDGGWIRGPHLTFAALDIGTSVRYYANFHALRHKDNAVVPLLAAIRSGRSLVRLTKSKNSMYVVEVLDGKPKIPADADMSPTDRAEAVEIYNEVIR